ncbi:hypothetical protein V8F33_013826 [Rhypophila sp. PSN 637]
MLWLLGALAAPILGAFGFGPLGPIAGSLAAFIQSTVYGAAVPAGSLFALLQRLAMTAFL